jgi:hypothetical protein
VRGDFVTLRAMLNNTCGPASPITTHQLDSVVKSARDIIRKDKGLSGGLVRLPSILAKAFKGEL